MPAIEIEGREKNSVFNHSDFEKNKKKAKKKKQRKITSAADLYDEDLKIDKDVIDKFTSDVEYDLYGIDKSDTNEVKKDKKRIKKECEEKMKKEKDKEKKNKKKNKKSENKKEEKKMKGNIIINTIKNVGGAIWGAIKGVGRGIGRFFKSVGRFMGFGKNTVEVVG